MSYFLPISVGTFTKGLGFADLAPNLLSLARVRSGLAAAEQPAAAQAGALDAQARQHLLAGHQGTAQLPARFRAAGLVIYAFSLAIIAQAQSNSQELHNASIAIVDEDHSELSRRIAHAFLPPYFKPAG